MDVIRNPANNEGLAIKIREDSSKIKMHFLAKNFISQKWAAFLGRENSMNQHLRE